MIGWLKGNVRAVDPGGYLILDVGGVGYKVNVPQFMVDIPIGGDLELFIHTHVREDAIMLYGFATDAERLTFEKLIGAHGVGPSLGLSILSVFGVRDLYDIVVSENIDLLCTVPGIGKKTAAKLAIDLKSSIDELAAAQDSATRSLTGGILVDSALSGSPKSGSVNGDGVDDGSKIAVNSSNGSNSHGKDGVDEDAGSDAHSVGSYQPKGGRNGSSKNNQFESSRSNGNSRGVDSAYARSEARSALMSLGYSLEEIRVAMRDTGGAQSVEDILRNALKQLSRNRGM